MDLFNLRNELFRIVGPSGWEAFFYGLGRGYTQTILRDYKHEADAKKTAFDLSKLGLACKIEPSGGVYELWVEFSKCSSR